MGSLTLASREKLDNLIFVINCNLQRLDGPVRGNGKVIQELEAAFRGAGWNVIKVIWGGDWDALLARDATGLLVKRMGEVVDGEFQTYVTKDGAYIRKNFFGKYPRAAGPGGAPERRRSAARCTAAATIRRRSYNAYKAARRDQGPAHRDSGPDHQRLRAGRGRRGPQHHAPAEEAQRAGDRALPLALRNSHSGRSGAQRVVLPAARGQPGNGLHARAAAAVGRVCAEPRGPAASAIEAPPLEYFKESLEGSAGREVSSTMAFVRVLTLLMKHPQIGRRVVPIIPDEARTFGMESLFRQFGIYASQGQLYKPHDAEMFLYYKESKDGQILEEGITEAGSMASFTAAGTAYVELRRGDDPVLHLLLHVRFPARGRHGVGVRRRARQGFSVRRHGRAHHAGRRRFAAPGRSQPGAG